MHNCGTLLKVYNSDFTLAVQQVVKGKWDTPTIKVRRFSDWICASRYAPYAKNQQAIFFLQRSKWKKQNFWQVMGAGNEGEWDLHEGNFIDRTWTSRDILGSGFLGKLRGLQFWWRKWRGAEPSELERIISDQFPKDAMIDAIKIYPQCFDVSISSGQYRSVHEIKIVCPEPELTGYMNKSFAHRFIAGEFLRFREQLKKAAIDKMDEPATLVSNNDAGCSGLRGRLRESTRPEKRLCLT